MAELKTLLENKYEWQAMARGDSSSWWSEETICVPVLLKSKFLTWLLSFRFLYKYRELLLNSFLILILVSLLSGHCLMCFNVLDSITILDLTRTNIFVNFHQVNWLINSKICLVYYIVQVVTRYTPPHSWRASWSPFQSSPRSCTGRWWFSALSLSGLWAQQLVGNIPDIWRNIKYIQYTEQAEKCKDKRNKF